MKTVILSSLFLIFAFTFAKAKNEKFVKAMESALAELKNVQSSQKLTDWQAVINQFERIAKVEATEWLPGYYAAYCYTRMSYMVEDSDQKDKYVELAEALCDNALKISKHDELYVLRAMIAQANMAVNGAVRWMKQGNIFSENIEKAKQLNPKNPRIYYLEGNSLFYKPAMFGGGAKKACPIYKQALEKFANFTPQSSIAPNWGKQPTEEMMRKCNE
jgi:tetratricopeptide (TPR) repeat protein